MMTFTDPKTRTNFEVDKKLYNAINHSNEFVRKAVKRDLKSKLSTLLGIDDIQTIKGILKIYIEENKWKPLN